MSHHLMYGVVIERPRKTIHVLRVMGQTLESWEIDAIADAMRERLLSRGEQEADVVVVHGTSRETLQMFGDRYSVSRVRTAMFNAAVTWSSITLD